MKWTVILAEKPWVNPETLRLYEKRFEHKGVTVDGWVLMFDDFRDDAKLVSLMFYDEGQVGVDAHVRLHCGLDPKKHIAIVDFFDREAFLKFCLA